MPLPRVQTRVSLLSWPCVAATPAAMASASLAMWTGALMLRAARARVSSSAEAHAFELGQVGRVLDDVVADDAGDGDADGVDGSGSTLSERGYLRGDQLDQLAAGKRGEGLVLGGVFGKADGAACEALILKPAGYDVFGDNNADGGGHCDSPGLQLSTTGLAIEAGIISL